MNDDTIRDHLVKLLAWKDAHAGFDAAVADFPATLRGVRPEGLPHSAWELLEHIRLAQEDILDFCRNAEYKEKSWPADYWPKSPNPPSERTWNESIARFRSDRKAFQNLAGNPQIDLTSRIPHGEGQTYFREIVLAADHAAYHVGQIVLVRQLLGTWGK